MLIETIQNFGLFVLLAFLTIAALTIWANRK